MCVCARADQPTDQQVSLSDVPSRKVALPLAVHHNDDSIVRTGTAIDDRSDADTLDVTHLERRT